MVNLFAPLCPESLAFTLNQICFRLRRRLCLAGVAMLTAAGLGGAPLAAQTAHFSYGASVVADSSVLNNPAHVALDGSGNLYVADYGNDAVYKFAPNGDGSYTLLATVADSSVLSTPVGVAVDASGNVYVVDVDQSAVHKFAPNGSGGYTQLADVAASPTLTYPVSVAVDGSGNVFILDANHKALHKFMPSGSGGYTQLADVTGGSDLDTALDVAVDNNGNVFVVDENNYGDPGDSGHDGVYAYAPNGSGGYTRLSDVTDTSSPNAVAVDRSGNVYVAAGRFDVIYKFAPNGSGGYTQLANPAGRSILGDPQGIAVDGSGALYVADDQNQQVLKLQVAGVNFPAAPAGAPAATPLTLTFTFDTGGTIGTPVVLTGGAAGLDFSDAGTGTCNSNGTSYTYNANDTCTVDVQFAPQSTGTRSGAVELTNTSGAVVATAYVYGTGTGPQVGFLSGAATTLAGNLNGAFGVAVDGSGNLFVADSGDNTVKEVVAAGGYTTVNTLGGGFSFNTPYGVALDGAGNLFVADSGNGAVEELPASNGYSTVTAIGNGDIRDPVGVAVDGSGNVFVDDFSAMREIAADSGYTTVTTLGVTGFTEPYGIAVDAGGNVFVADTYNNAVEEITAASGYTSKTSIGSGLSLPFSVNVDGNGNVFVGDAGSSTVKEIVAAGGYATVRTFAGAHISNLYGVAVDGAGNVYMTDAGRSAVREFNVATPPSVRFPTLTTQGSQDTADGTATVTVENNGNADLSFTVPGTGDNPSFPNSFLYDSGSTCPKVSSAPPYTLAAGASCSLGIDFQPAAGGQISGNVVLTDNNLNAANAVQSIPVSGTGKATPTVGASAVTQTYGTAASSTLTVSGSGDTPTGSITYSIDDETAVTVPLDGGQYVAQIPALLSAGSHTLTASYSGDGNYDAVDSATVVSWTTATATVQSLAGSAVTQSYGSETSSLITVTGVTGAEQPSGSVTYSIDGGTAVTATLSGGQYDIPIPATLGGGSHTLAVSYSGDGNYSPVSSATLQTWTTSKSAVQTVSSTSVSQTYGTAASATVTVTQYTGEDTPTGSITYSIDGGSGVTATLTGGQFVVPIAATLSAGDHTLAASYSGDGNYTAVSSATLVSWTTAKAAVLSVAGTTVTQTYGVVAGSAVTVTGVSGGTTPTGSITYSIDGGTAVTASLSGGQYVVPIAATLAAGSHTLAASYSGDSNYTAVSSATLESWTTAKAAVLSIAGTTVTQIYGAAAGSTITVAGVVGAATPTGSITYSIDGGTGITASLSGGQYVAPIPAALAAGSHTLAVSYSGDGDYSSAGPSTVATWTTAKATPPSVAGTAVTQIYGVATSSTVTVTGITGAATPTGTVTWSIDSGTATPVTLSGGTAAVPVPTSLTPGPHSIALTYSGDSNYTAASGTVGITTGLPTLTVTASNASRVYGAANPVLGGTYSGQLNSDTFTVTATTTATATSPVSSYPIVPLATGANLSGYILNYLNGALTVTQASSAVALAQTAPATAGVGIGVSTTFRATVTDATTGSAGTPTGTVQFFDGTGSLGTATLNSGVATLTAVFASTGTHAITAIYSGDVNFTASTSATFSEPVGTPGFTATATNTSLRVFQGSSAYDTITLTPTNNYQGTVNFSCTGLPKFASCSFLPATVTFTGDNVAQLVVLSVATTGSSASLRSGNTQSRLAGVFWLPGTGLALLLAIRRKKLSVRLRGMTTLLLLVVGLAGLAGLAGCASGMSNAAPAGSHPVTVAIAGTGASGSSSSGVSQSLNITIDIVAP